MVEHLDDLDVAPARQRQDDVAGAEPRVNATVDRLHTDALAEPFRRRVHAIMLGRI